MVATAKQENIDSLLKGITIPSPPQILADIQMEMAMPDADLGHLAKIIANDAGLSGAIIKILHSPYYGGANESTSIPQAVLMLGEKTTMDIVNSICIKNATINFDEMPDNVYSTLNRFWDSASDVAKVCELIAAQIGISRDENVYLLGLFHNVGIALLIARHEKYLDIIEKSYAETESRIVDVENEAYDTNHAVLSYYIAKSWKLAPNLCRIISMHHNPSTFTSSEHIDEHNAQLLGILKIAEHIVGLHRILGNQDIDHEWGRISENVMLMVGMTSYELDDLKAQTVELGYGQQLYFR